jgi:hypothetical protein
VRKAGGPSCAFYAKWPSSKAEDGRREHGRPISIRSMLCFSPSSRWRGPIPERQAERRAAASRTAGLPRRVRRTRPSSCFVCMQQSRYVLVISTRTPRRKHNSPLQHEERLWVVLRRRGVVTYLTGPGTRSSHSIPTLVAVDWISGLRRTGPEGGTSIPGRQVVVATATKWTVRTLRCPAVKPSMMQ